MASARPCEIRNSAASAPQATTNAAPIMAGNVQSAVHGDAAWPPCSTIGASLEAPRSHFIIGGGL
jgi:hypothetical protein